MATFGAPTTKLEQYRITHDSGSTSNEYVEYLSLSYYAKVLIKGAGEIILLICSFPILFISESDSKFKPSIVLYWTLDKIPYAFNVWQCFSSHGPSYPLQPLNSWSSHDRQVLWFGPLLPLRKGALLAVVLLSGKHFSPHCHVYLTNSYSFFLSQLRLHFFWEVLNQDWLGDCH